MKQDFCSLKNFHRGWNLFDLNSLYSDESLNVFISFFFPQQIYLLQHAI